MAWPELVLQITGKLKDDFLRLNTYFSTAKAAWDAHVAGTADKHLISSVLNDSSEAGTTAKDALDHNKGRVDAHIAGTADKHSVSNILNDSAETGSTAKDALDHNKGRVDSHVAGITEKHAAQDITYSGGATGADVKSAIDGLQAELTNLSFTGSEHDPLVTAALVDTEGENFGDAETYLHGRLSKWENIVLAETKPVVVFTFDDGYTEDSLTYSILKEYGFVGCFGPIVDNLYVAGKNPIANYYQYQKEGFEICSHSSTHANLGTVVDDSVVDYEYRQSADKLRGLGFAARGLIVPYSSARSEYYAIAAQIYDYILIGGTGLNGKGDFKSNKTLTRISQYNQGVAGSQSLIDQAINDKKLLIFYDHRIGNTGALSEADFRSILDYVKTKSDAGLIKVLNIANAVSYYYGIDLKQRNIPISIKNYAPLVTDSSWVLQDVNTIGAIIAVDSSYTEAVEKITIPANAAVDSVVNFYNTVNLPASLNSLGDRVNIGIDAWPGNSQAAYFNPELDVLFLDSNGNTLQTVTYPFKLQYNAAIQISKLLIPCFLNPGIDINAVKSIKIVFKITVAISPTVSHPISLSNVNITFPNSRYNPVSGSVSTREIVNMNDGNLSGLPHVTWTVLHVDTNAFNTAQYSIPISGSYTLKALRYGRFRVIFNPVYIVSGLPTNSKRFIVCCEKNVSSPTGNNDYRYYKYLADVDSQVLNLMCIYEFVLNVNDTLTLAVFDDNTGAVVSAGTAIKLPFIVEYFSQ